jgi:catalase
VHTNNNDPLDRNTGWRYLFIAAVITGLAVGFLYAAGVLGGKGVTAQTFVNLQEGKTPSPGFRRAHAKGICVSGEFESNGALAEYSSAEIFQAGSSPFIGRFSIAGNNPLAPDLKAPVRSLALSFSFDNGQQWRLAMNTPPVMAVSTPEDFFEQLMALSPDAKTGKRDPQKIKDFFAAHPESKDFNAWRASYTPTNSFADEQYHSINAFYLVDEQGNQQAVRWAAVPTSASTLELGSNTADALQLDLISKLKDGPVRFDMVFSFADASDDENNPAIAWPNERKTLTAGTINITSSEAQTNGACDGIRFDPLILPQGIAPTNDPILRARSAAYAESYRRRAREQFLGETKGAEK